MQLKFIFRTYSLLNCLFYIHLLLLLNDLSFVSLYTFQDLNVGYDTTWEKYIPEKSKELISFLFLRKTFSTLRWLKSWSTSPIKTGWDSWSCPSWRRESFRENFQFLKGPTRGLERDFFQGCVEMALSWQRQIQIGY